MEKFLSKAAKIIVNDDFHGPDSVVILPNHRSEIFLKQEIKKLNKKGIWLPDFYTIEEFIQKISGLRKADNITTIFELFNVYKTIEGENAKSIDEFISWAPMIINDFNDIDSSLVDAKNVYQQLSAIKAIQQWNPENRPLTELQTNYLRFFNSMYDYYTGLKEKLTSNNTGYQGMIARHLAENIKSKSEKLRWNKYLIIGINALSESEIEIFEYINLNFKSEFLWDLDQYYFNNIDGHYSHEAGKHIHYIIKKLKLEIPDKIDNNLLDSEKTIRTLGVPKNIGQVKFIGQEFSKNHEYNNSNTAIVLANESLLIPLLNSLPDSNETNKYNLTLGYPLADSQADQLFSSWTDMMKSMFRNNNQIDSVKFINLLNNPILKQILNTEKNITDEIINQLITNNSTRISFNELITTINIINKNTGNIISKLLNDCNTSNLSVQLENLINLLVSSIDSNNKSNILFQEQLHSLVSLLSKLSSYSSDYKDTISYYSLKKIGKQLIGQSTINLIGEPLQGTQIMGMLETRTLDFDNIFIMSVNEGILPKTSSMDSFIPMDIRRELNLPLPSDKTDIYSYHFFRLLQRCKNVTIVYNSDSEKLGGGEKSRFILQIENELLKSNQRIKYSNCIISTGINQEESKIDNKKVRTIEKNEEILQKLIDISISGYSASSLVTYITCQLKYYYQYILKLKSESTLEQSIEANTFGTVVHEALEDIYKPLVNKPISSEEIKSWIGNSDSLLLAKFKKNYKNDKLISGKNLLIFEVAKNYIDNFLKWDISNQKAFPSILLSTEETIVAKFPGSESKINIKGTIDRVDQLVSNGVVRIADYKTGFVNPTSLKVSDISLLVSDPKFAKPFQVLYYAWLYKLVHNVDNLQTGIISIRNMSNGYIPLVLKEFDNINDCFTHFEKHVYQLISEILNKKIPFIATDDIDRCSYCDYKSICNQYK